jgi:hypothetical protein
LSTEDPWATAPAEAPADEAQAAPAESPVVGTATIAVKPVLVGGGDEITLTFKEGGGFDASWIVIRAESVASANAILDDHVDLQALMAKTKAVAGFFRGGDTAKTNAPASGGQAAQSRVPAGAQQAPNGETRSCSHGPMEFKSGVSKAGNAYKLFSCTAPRDSQCKAEYLR